MAQNQSYSDKLKDPRWQKKRLEIMQRDEFTCQDCGVNDVELQVHHLSYNKDCDIWDYKNDDLTTLCRDCHEQITKTKKEIYEMVNSNCFFRDRAESLLDIIKIYSGLNYGEIIRLQGNIKQYLNGRLD